MAKALLISLLFLIGWFFIGPLALAAVSPLLWRRGPSRANLPSANIAVLLPFLLGVLFNVILNQFISEDEIPPILTTLADLQFVQTAASLAVSEGRSEMSLIFAMELLVSLLFVPVILILIYREGSFRSTLDTILDEMREVKGVRPFFIWFFAGFFALIILISFYFWGDLSNRSLRRRPYVLPIFPILWFFLVAAAWRLSALFLSSEASKK